VVEVDGWVGEDREWERERVKETERTRYKAG
jgi:hypothetical protein